MYFIICLLNLPVIVNTGITHLIHVSTVGVSSLCCWVSTTCIIINTAEIINKQAETSFLWQCISAWDYQVYSSSCTDPRQTVDMSHLQPTRPNLGSGCHEAKSFFLFFHWSANRVPSTVSSLWSISKDLFIQLAWKCQFKLQCSSMKEFDIAWNLILFSVHWNNCSWCWVTVF